MVPTYDQFYKPILEMLSDGILHSSKETIEYCANAFHLTDEDRAIMVPSGSQTVLVNRVAWARTYLKKAGLIASPSRGQYQITGEGRKALKNDGILINNNYLQQYQSYRQFKGLEKIPDHITGASVQSSNSVSGKIADASSETPLEIMNSAYQELNGQLADELMSNIMEQEPSFFERLVVELLEKMGYGSEIENAGEVTGKPGDEGIDGIIRQDTLGFDKIYVQAKRWTDDHIVGEPDIQQFAGALMGKGATKGLFITTSHFSKKAVDYVAKHMSAKIVLIDGARLTNLMIQNGLGVSTIYTFAIKRIDSDYFDDGNE